MRPKLMIATVGKATYLFLDGKCISGGVLKADFSTHNGEDLSPTLNLKINVDGFSFEDGETFEEFAKKIGDLREELSQLSPEAEENCDDESVV